MLRVLTALSSHQRDNVLYSVFVLFQSVYNQVKKKPSDTKGNRGSKKKRKVGKVLENSSSKAARTDMSTSSSPPVNQYIPISQFKQATSFNPLCSVLAFGVPVYSQVSFPSYFVQVQQEPETEASTLNFANAHEENNSSIALEEISIATIEVDKKSNVYEEDSYFDLLLNYNDTSEVALPSTDSVVDEHVKKQEHLTTPENGLSDDNLDLLSLIDSIDTTEQDNNHFSLFEPTDQNTSDKQADLSTIF